jgi:hypothetical protein
MKTFNDTNSEIQQKRLQGSTFVIRVELFRQFSGKIKTVNDTSKQIVVSGDCTAFVIATKYILIPLHDMQITYLVNTVSYSSGSDETTITIASGTLDATMVDLEIARMYTVSYGDVERMIEMSPISFKTEGDTLNEFLADDVSFLFNNGDGFFSNKDDTGIFDQDDVFWVRVFTGYKYSSDRILFFGGIIDEESLVPNRSDKTFEITAFGHIKELERYPGYLITDISGEFVKISGLTIKSFEAGSNVQEGVKKIKYEPFSRGRIDGILIEKVSHDLIPGPKVLEFRYPFSWRFDSGPWVEIKDISDVNSNGNATLYAKGGSGSNLYAIVNFGTDTNLNNFPDRDEIMLVDIVSDDNISNKVKDGGKPVLTFDEGQETDLIFTFPRVLIYDASLTTYTDKADSAADLEDYFEVLNATSDELIIIASAPFFGLDFLFNSFFSGATISLYYSVGGESWSGVMTSSNNGLADGTNDFANDGDILWNNVSGWRENYISIDASTDYRGYMIKIVRSGGSGTCNVDLIRPVIRCRGKRNDFLNLKTNIHSLTTESVDDELIIRLINGAYLATTWFQNHATNDILSKVLNEAKYFAADQDLDSFKMQTAQPGITIWGRPPKYNYRKKPTALLVDGETVYIGVGNEIWKAEAQGGMSFLCAVKLTGYSIVWIVKEGTDLLFVADKLSIQTAGNDSLLRSFKYDLTTGLISELFTSSYSTYNSGRYFFREGYASEDATKYEIHIGHTGLGGFAGENVTVPFRQIMTTINDCEVVQTGGLLSTGDQKYKINYNTTNNRNYNAFQGHYRLIVTVYKATGDPAPSPIGVVFSFGQQGTVIYDTTEKCFYYFRYLSNIAMYGADHSKNINKYSFLRFVRTYLDMPMCATYYNENVYLGFITWDEIAPAQRISPSYLTQYKPNGRVNNLAKVFRTSNGTVFFDVTNDINNDTAFVQMGNNEVLYVSSNRKFLSLYFNIQSTNLVATVNFDYWDGTAWSSLTQENDLSNLTQSGTITWAMPRDWTKDDFDTITSATEDAVDRYWIRVSLSSWTSGTADIIGLENRWHVLWDSQIDNSGNYDSFTPLWVSYDSLSYALHGCMFDKDETSNYGFDYLYFIYDILTETLYVSQTGSNFTFNPSMIIKDFVYDVNLGKTYAICEDIRYNEEPAFLISTIYNSGSGTITLTKESEIITGDWGSSCPMAMGNNNAVYGITKGQANYLWQYATDFYPRLLVANFGDMDFRKICAEAATIISQVFTIRSNRKVVFYERTNYDGEKKLYEYEQLVDINPVKRYKHVYDGIEVGWEDPLSGASGTSEYGNLGWRRKVLRIESVFIQNRFLADVVAEKYANYFLTKRSELEAETTALIQAEERDRVQLIASSNNYDVDRNTWWLLNDIEFDPETLVMKIKGVN